MLILRTPQGRWQAEKEYVARCVLEWFLGIQSLTIEAGVDDCWNLGDGVNWIAFPNVFFPEKAPSIYLSREHINIWRGKASFVDCASYGVKNYPNPDIPLIFPNDKHQEAGGMGVGNLDIFGTIFFFLSRYEEYLSFDGDEIGRFSSEQSLATSFLQRPVVDEYLWLLADHLKKSFPNVVPVLSGYRLELSHDIDVPHSWLERNSWLLLRSMARGVLKERSLSQTLTRMRSYFDVRYDPAFCFDWMMKEAESRGLSSTFYLLTGGNHPYDLNYDLFSTPIRSLLEDIQARGHKIGLHGSIESAVCGELLRSERLRLESASKLLVTKGRQHFLRFCAPLSWQAMVTAGITEDSTLGYHDRAGFRCGTARSFQVFDVGIGKVIPLQEQPLICMEHSLLAQGYQGLSFDDAYDYARNLWEQVKKFGGNFTLLWHNHNLVTKSQKDLFRKMLDDAS